MTCILGGLAVIYLKYILPVLFILLLFLLRRYFPNQRVFMIFCVVLAAAAAAIFVSYEPKPQPIEISQEERDATLLQQQIFASWYDEYKRDIDRMDHNWQQYHRILSDFKEDNISIQTAWLRLTQLENEAVRVRDDLQQLNPPKELNDNNYDLVIEIMKKTRTYSLEQYRAISLTRAAADPSGLLPKKQEEQSNRLQEVMLRESPVGLFTASEISAIRDNLSLPEEN